MTWTRATPPVALACALAIGVVVSDGCVPPLDEEGRPCPCGEGFRCSNGICQSLPPPRCGDGYLEPLEGEICEDGIDNSGWLLNAKCEQCDVVCEEGFADCDRDLGCEADLSTPAFCGACDHRCEHDATECRAGRCLVPIAVEDTGVSGVTLAEGELFWTSRGTGAGDVALRRWRTQVSDEIVIETLEDALSEVRLGPVLAGAAAERSLVWVSPEPAGGAALIRRSASPVGFSAVTYGPAGTDAQSLVGSSSDVWWSAVDAAAKVNVVWRWVPGDSTEQVAADVGAAYDLQRSGDFALWRDEGGVSRVLSNGGAPERVIEGAVDRLVVDGPMLVTLEGGRLLSRDLDGSSPVVLQEDPGIYEVAEPIFYYFWLSHEEDGDALWFLPYGGTPSRLFGGLENAHHLTASSEGILWVEGDAPGALYFLRNDEI